MSPIMEDTSQTGLVPTRSRRNALGDIFQGMHPEIARQHILAGRSTPSSSTDTSPVSDTDVTVDASGVTSVETSADEDQQILDIVHSSRYRRRRNAMHDLGLGQIGLHRLNNHFCT